MHGLFVCYNYSVIGNRKKLSILPALFTVVAFVVAISSAHAAAGTPSIMSYQGRLADASGNLLGSSSGTTYYFKFSIWDVPTGGTASPDRLWPSGNPTSVPLSVRSGVFTVNIGDTAAGFPDALTYDFNTSSDAYLQVEVSSDNSSFQTLSPRHRISATPFARLSGAVSGSEYPSSFGTTVPFGTSVVSVKATSTGSTPLSLRGILNQLANLFQVQNSSGANVFSIDPTGGVFASSTLLVGSTTGATAFSIDANGRTGVGTAAPSRKLNVVDPNSVPQLRVSQDGSTYGEMYVDPTGDVQFSSTGGNIRQGDENLWVCSGGSCGVDTPVDKGNVIVETSVIFNNKFRLKQTDASTTVMYDSAGNDVMEFDEAQ